MGRIQERQPAEPCVQYFDVLVTVDQRLRHQQNLAQFDIGVVVIETFDTTLPNLRRLLPEIREAIETVASGAILIIKA